MKVEQQKTVLPIKNHDSITLYKGVKKHGVLFGGSSKRALVVGRSGSGKTNVILSLLEHPNGLRFENIYVYSKSLYQPKYEYLKVLLTPIKEIGYHEFKDGDRIVQPDDIKPNAVIIFDDVVSCDQNIIRSYFSFGRHKNTDCFYLCQTYSSIPKQLIRDNANLIIAFAQDITNLKHIYNDHVCGDMSFGEFQRISAFCWKDPFGFLVIDKDCEIKKGKYRKGFDTYINP